MSEALETIYALDGKRRVVIFRRTDGSFSYREEYHYINDYDKDHVFEGWAELPPGKSIYNSLETARREVVAKFSWTDAIDS